MVNLRNFTEKDVAELQRKKYRNITENEIIEMIREMNTHIYSDKYFEMFAVVDEDEIVGMISLYEQSKSVISCGPEIFEDYRRRGYGYEALTSALTIAWEKGYKIAVAQIRVDNAASIALHKKAGFEMNHEYINAKGNKVLFMLRVTEEKRK